MKDGVRILNVRPRAADRRRGPAGRAGLRQGRRRRARRLPQRADDRAPALRATRTSSSRRTSAPRPPRRPDRAGFQAAEQVVAALTGGSVTTAVNVPAVAAEDLEVLGPFLPLCRRLGRLAAVLARERLDRPHRGRVPRPPRRSRLPAADDRGAARRPRRPHRGGGQRRQRAEHRVRARHRTCRRRRARSARDFTELVRVTVVSRRQADARRRHDARPPQPPASARGLGPALQPAARGPPGALPLRRPCPA